MSVDWLQILDPEGNVDKSLEPALDNEMLEKFYRTMVLTRLYDEISSQAPAPREDAHLRLMPRAGSKPDRKRFCHET